MDAAEGSVSGAWFRLTLSLAGANERIEGVAEGWWEGVASETGGLGWGTGVRPPPLRFEWNGRTAPGEGPQRELALGKRKH